MHVIRFQRRAVNKWIYYFSFVLMVENATRFNLIKVRWTSGIPTFYEFFDAQICKSDEGSLVKLVFLL